MKHYIFFRKIPPDVGYYGGCEKVLLDWFTGVDFNKIKITLVITKGWQAILKEKKEWNNIPINIAEFNTDFQASFLNNFIENIMFLIKIKPTHIVYMQGAFNEIWVSDILAGFICTFGNVFVTEHSEAPIIERKKIKYHFGFIPGFGLWWHKRRLKYLFRAYITKRILAISNTVAERMIKVYGFPKKKIFIAYHGIDINNFSPNTDIREAMRARFNIPQGDTVIISTSRLSKEKRLDRIINAFDKVYEKYTNLWLFMIGDGLQREELQNLANKKLSKDRIKFLGFQSEVVDYLRMSDIYVLSSGIEEYAIAMIEAMSTGLISVITEVPGSYSLIKDGENGFLVEATDEGIVEGISKALSLSYDERKQISIKSRKFAEKFEIHNSVREALKILGLC